MRQVNVNIISGVDRQNQASSQIDSNQLLQASFQANFSDATAGGTFKLQVSNDVCPAGQTAQNFVVTNWIDLPNQSASVASGAAKILSVADMAYRWIRAIWTTTAAGVQTIAPIADTGVKQVQTVTTVLDVAGSLNSTYFLLSSVNLVTKAQKNFYLWLDDGGGVDPAIAGKTGIHVTYSDGDSANTIATAIRAALNALTNDFVATGANAAVIITMKAAGPVTAAVDGAAPTGFTFGAATSGVASNLNNKYFLIQDAAATPNLFYVWFNVDTIGTAPAPAGRTAIVVNMNSGSSAGTIGGLMATAIAAANGAASFSTSGTTTVQVTMLTTGPWVPASDFNSGFTFASTGGGTGTLTVNFFAMGV